MAESSANAGDTRNVGSILGKGRYPGRAHGNPLQCSLLGNPIDRGAWQATVHGVTESDMTERRSIHTWSLYAKSVSSPLIFEKENIITLN